MTRRIPVLTYHSLTGSGDEYNLNDHIALEADLAMIYGLGGRIADLSTIAKFAALGQRYDIPDGLVVGISFDDGPNFDYLDFYHPEIGTYLSFYNIILQSALYQEGRFIHERPFATSFVIVSPEARKALDVSCIAGRGDWRDDWWLSAAQSGILQIANHSWDHVHPSLSRVAQKNQKKGSFMHICSQEDAHEQILVAQNCLDEKLGILAAQLFAYPYGDVNEYLKNEFFPSNSDRFIAAFSTAGEYVCRASNRWTLPRFVCGNHWKSPDELLGILQSAN